IREGGIPVDKQAADVPASSRMNSLPHVCLQANIESPTVFRDWLENDRSAPFIKLSRNCGSALCKTSSHSLPTGDLFVGVS
ncbi:hypothetical protein, partial [Pseudomonas syringae group sp. J309-1]|uniref:hypothetical protein n=1 Tax=Pseudomonas syringae group sp. J309-1 TaxID=3079588 RepID=UPI0029067326